MIKALHWCGWPGIRCRSGRSNELRIAQLRSAAHQFRCAGALTTDASSFYHSLNTSLSPSLRAPEIIQ